MVEFVRVTLLAGFVIGDAGFGSRNHTAHGRRSILDATGGVFFGSLRDQREFCVEGESTAIAQATELIYAAVDRYRALCEMKKRGEFVQLAKD